MSRRTRSKCSLKNVSIQDLLLNKSNKSNKKTSESSVSTTKRTNEVQTESLFNPIRLGTVCILDTESFELNNKLLTMQFAYSIVDYSNVRKPRTIVSKMIYCADLLLYSHYRHKLISHSKFSERCLARHEENMKTNNFPVKSAKDIMNIFAEDLMKYNVSTLCGFNLEWDLKAIKETLLEFDPTNNFFTLKHSCNPLSFSSLNLCDMMHNSYVVFGNELIENGLINGTIDHNGRKRNKKTAGVFSMENVMKYLDTKSKTKDAYSQLHLALSDVKDTHSLLNKFLKKINYDDSLLEYNLIYIDPLYKKTQKIAPKLWNKIRSKITYSWHKVYASKEEVDCEFCGNPVLEGEECYANNVKLSKAHINCYKKFINL